MDPAPLKLGTPAFVGQNLAKALSHPARTEIMTALSLRVMSAIQFQRKFPAYTYNQISHHFRALEKYGCIERVGEKSGGRRRGGKEVFFRATTAVLFDQTNWAEVPESLRTTISGATAVILIRRISEALQEGTMDIRPDRHLTWTAARYDEQAWNESIEEVEAVFAKLPQRQAEAAVRLAESGEEPIHATVTLGCFPSPKPAEDD